MCRLPLALFVSAILAPVCVSQSYGNLVKTFGGEVMCSPCAKTGKHNGGYSMTATKTPKECTLACEGASKKFVLYDAENKFVYQLDSPDKLKEFAGQKVRVTGVFDGATKTIHVHKIEAVHQVLPARQLEPRRSLDRP